MSENRQTPDRHIPIVRSQHGAFTWQLFEGKSP